MSHSSTTTSATPSKPTLRSALKWSFDNLIPPWPREPMDCRLKNRILELETNRTDENVREIQAKCPEIVNGAWKGLRSMGYEIVRHHRPKVIVELGSYSGLSTFCMGLALRDLGEGGKIYAVDTWKGDAHMGDYGDDVYRAFLKNRADLGLDEIIIPMRMTFAEAAAKISSPVDLLHIDGLHTFAAARNDFQTYRPHLNKGSIVLFHDVYTHFRGMRVLWTLLSLRYQTYRVPYSNGLGILRYR